MTDGKPESNSLSTTTPEPTEPVLVGKAGSIFIGDKEVATKTAWTLKRRSYVDASAFGEDNKRYLAPLSEVAGTFSGDLSDEWVEFGDRQNHVYLYAQQRPAWWGRLKHWLLREPWPSYVISDFDAEITYERVGEPKGEWNVAANWTATGPVVLHVPPISRLERYWDRVCHPFR